MLSASGLGSGLDINGMVTQLVAAERLGSDKKLSRDKADINAQLSAFGALKSAVSGFQGSLSGLNSLSNFDKRKATTSDVAALALNVSDTATPASYSMEVSQLAASHSLASQAVAKKDTALGTGTLTIRFGTLDYDASGDTWNGFSLNADRATASIAITSGNDTLEGIMKTINEADIGVNASIVNDGGGYRLLLSSANSGAANALEISISDDDGDNLDAAGLSRFAFNAQATHMTQSTAARDAQLTINGLAVSSASNTVTSAIEGLTLNLKKVTTEKVEVSVAKDSAPVTAAVNAFIAGYNKFVATVNDLTRYDPATKAAGQLLGDFTVRSMQSQVDRILRNPVSGLTGDYTALFELGITSGSNGQLSLDSARFQEALSTRPGDVRAVFTAFGAVEDAQVVYKGATSATRTGNYAVELTALATAGSFAGEAVLPDFSVGETLVIDGDNDELTVNVDGAEATGIQLTAGTYSSGESLAEELQARINGDANLRAAGVSVKVSHDADAGRLVITSEALGSTSSVTIAAVDTATAATLGFAAGDGAPGTDVAGSIGGLAAEGSGNRLTGTEGDAAGLALAIEGGNPGALGSVNFTRGLADQLKLYLDQILDTEEGLIELRLSSLKDRSESLEDRRAALELRWQAVEARYRRQFNALDSLLASLQSTSSYLEGQLASLPGPRKPSS